MRTSGIIKIAFVAMSLLTARTLSAQQTTEPFSYNADITPSVESWKMTQYGSLKPSLYTGTMTYSLPLYTYKDEDFTIPISLEYSYGGYKPAVHSGLVALGWTLTCGGVITREVRGMPDDLNELYSATYGFWKTVSDSIPSNSEYAIMSGKIMNLSLASIPDIDPVELDLFTDAPVYGNKTYPEDNMNRYDPNPDLFHFSFLGITGDFMMTDSGEIRVFNTSRPQGEFSITIDADKSDRLKTPEITIDTGDGYSYTFGGTRQSTEYCVMPQGDDEQSITISAWHLRRITAPNGHTAEYVFDENHQRENAVIKSFTNAIMGTSINNTTESRYYVASEYKPRGQSSYIPVLSSITVDEMEAVSFIYGYSEMDENDDSHFYSGAATTEGTNPNFKRDSTRNLQEITVKNRDGFVVEKASLSKENAGGSRILLKSVNSLASGTYTFSYCDSADLPKNDTDCIDHWGYWNDFGNSEALKKEIDYENLTKRGDLYAQLPTSCRAPSFRKTLSCALSEIQYPTGGRTEIEYEPHSASLLINRLNGSPLELTKNTSNFIPGGIRISSLISYTEKDTIHVKYGYSLPETQDESSGILMRMPRYASGLKYSFYTKNTEYDIITVGYTSECFPTGTSGDPEVCYGNVRELYDDKSYVDYEFSTWKEAPDLYYTEGSAAYEKAYGDNMKRIDMSSSSYDVRLFMIPERVDNRSTRGRLLSIKEYDSTDFLVKENRNEYESVEEISQPVVFNTIADYTGYDWKFNSAYLIRSQETRFEKNGGNLKQWKSMSYNSSGQNTQTVDFSEGYDKAVHILYADKDLVNCPPYLRSAVSGIAQTRQYGDSTYLISVEKLEYDTMTVNPNPVRLTIWMPEIPQAVDSRDMFTIPEEATVRTMSLTYDSKNRPVRVNLPGNAYISYGWDASGRHIVSKTVNGKENRSAYTWIDLIGLSSLSSPSGQTEHYEYDSHNRLSVVRNTEGQKTASYLYHLKHE